MTFDRCSTSSRNAPAFGSSIGAEGPTRFNSVAPPAGGRASGATAGCRSTGGLTAVVFGGAALAKLGDGVFHVQRFDIVGILAESGLGEFFRAVRIARRQGLLRKFLQALRAAERKPILACSRLCEPISGKCAAVAFRPLHQSGEIAIRIARSFGGSGGESDLLRTGGGFDFVLHFEGAFALELADHHRIAIQPQRRSLLGENFRHFGRPFHRGRP